jgi:hypothetical protein
MRSVMDVRDVKEARHQLAPRERGRVGEAREGQTVRDAETRRENNSHPIPIVIAICLPDSQTISIT